MKLRYALILVLFGGLVILTGCLFSSGPWAEFTAVPRFDYPPLEVHFDASASSSPNGIITSYNWDFGDGEIDTGVTVTHTYWVKGIYPVTLTVTDTAGKVGMRTRTVEALNRAPHAQFEYWPYMVGVDQAMTFDASESYDEDGYIVEWIWSFGDGSSGAGEEVEHTYLSAGTNGYKYPVTLTVIDEDGASGSLTRYVQVIGCDSCP